MTRPSGSSARFWQRNRTFRRRIWASGAPSTKRECDEQALAEAKKFFAVLGDREVVESLDRGGAEAGYRGAMTRAGDELAARSERSHVPGIRIARVYAHAGENDRALDWLEKAYERRETTLVHIGVGWDWDGLRSDPRFQSLLRRMKLPQ